MIALGFEPRTASLEGRCSIQLSYATSLSGWQDSNLRPPRPKRGAITGLRYTPNRLSRNLILFFDAERKGFEPPVPVRVQLLSREPRSTTLAPLQFLVNKHLKLRMQIYFNICNNANKKGAFFLNFIGSLFSSFCTIDHNFIIV